MRTQQQNSQPSVSRIRILVILIALTLLSGSREALAQQWSTSSNGIDIFNSNSGNVGVGTISPGVKLDILSSTNLIARFGSTTPAHTQVIIDSLASHNSNLTLQRGGVPKWYMGNRAATDRLSFIESTGITEVLTLTQDGNVGVGTIAPQFKLDILSTSTTLVARFATPTHSQVLIDAGPAHNSNLTLQRSGVSKWYLGNRASDDRLSFVNSTGTAEMLALLQNGNVGVGTTSPTEKLQVAGNVKVSGNIDVGGNINAKYQDLAEWVDSSQELSASTVVILDSTKSNQVIASTRSYDSRVAGVISSQPGLALGEKADGRVLVATTGRVKVKVDATNGPIQIGDLLVTSKREGFAMKSIPMKIGGGLIHRPGTLIGKALEPLASGTAEILVLLSLQ